MHVFMHDINDSAVSVNQFRDLMYQGKVMAAPVAVERWQLLTCWLHPWYSSIFHGGIHRWQQCHWNKRTNFYSCLPTCYLANLPFKNLDDQQVALTSQVLPYPLPAHPTLLVATDGVFMLLDTSGIPRCFVSGRIQSTRPSKSDDEAA